MAPKHCDVCYRARVRRSRNRAILVRIHPRIAIQMGEGAADIGVGIRLRRMFRLHEYSVRHSFIPIYFRVLKGVPNHKTSLINQKLQMLNCCIQKKIKRENKDATSEDSDTQAQPEKCKFYIRRSMTTKNCVQIGK